MVGQQHAVSMQSCRLNSDTFEYTGHLHKLLMSACRDPCSCMLQFMIHHATGQQYSVMHHRKIQPASQAAYHGYRLITQPQSRALWLPQVICAAGRLTHVAQICASSPAIAMSTELSFQLLPSRRMSCGNKGPSSTKRTDPPTGGTSKEPPLLVNLRNHIYICRLKSTCSLTDGYAVWVHAVRVNALLE